MSKPGILLDPGRIEWCRGLSCSVTPEGRLCYRGRPEVEPCGHTSGQGLAQMRQAHRAQGAYHLRRFPSENDTRRHLSPVPAPPRVNKKPGPLWGPGSLWCRGLSCSVTPEGRLCYRGRPEVEPCGHTSGQGLAQMRQAHRAQGAYHLRRFPSENDTRRHLSPVPAPPRVNKKPGSLGEPGLLW